MNSEDRVGVIQAHNLKGEVCGISIQFGDLDKEFRDMIKWCIEKRELYQNFARDMVMGTKPDELNWLEKRPDGGVCMQCDYGDGVQGMVEHDHKCLFRLMVIDLHKDFPED